MEFLPGEEFLPSWEPLLLNMVQHAARKWQFFFFSFLFQPIHSVHLAWIEKKNVAIFCQVWQQHGCVTSMSRFKSLFFKILWEHFPQNPVVDMYKQNKKYPTLFCKYLSRTMTDIITNYAAVLMSLLFSKQIGNKINNW